jgi:hypothetical protein
MAFSLFVWVEPNSNDPTSLRNICLQQQGLPPPPPFFEGGCRHDMVIQANVHDDINVTLVVLAIRRPSSNALLLTTCFWLLLLTRPSRPFWGRPFLKFPSNWCAAAGINNDWATVKVGLSGGGCDCIYISKINASFEIALGNDGPTVDAVTLNCCNGSFCCPSVCAGPARFATAFVSHQAGQTRASRQS